MDSLAKKKVLTFGEIVFDMFPDGARLGGAPLNFAYFCSKLGADSSIISAVGCDEFGDAALAKLERCSIRNDFVLRKDDFPTGRVRVTIEEDNSHTFEICSPAAWDQITCSDEAIESSKKAEVFYFGTLAQRGTVSKETLLKLLDSLNDDCLRVFDANLRQDYYNDKMLIKSLEQADILKVNEAELPILARAADIIVCENRRGLSEALLDKFNLEYVLLTLGAEGYRISVRGSETISGNSEYIDVVDTVGAGDSFTSAFTMAILDGCDPDLAAIKAADLSRTVCGMRGVFYI